MGLISIFDDSDFQTPEQLDYLLKNAQVEVDGVWIKATQGLWWKSTIADKLAAVCINNNTAHGYYHFAESSMMASQRGFFSNAIKSWPIADLGVMLDYEDPGALAKGLLGIAHFTPDIAYGPESFWESVNWGDDLPCVKWLAQYFNDRRLDMQQAAFYREKGIGLWQYADYFVDGSGKQWNQDVSVLLLDSFQPLKAPSVGL